MSTDAALTAAIEALRVELPARAPELAAAALKQVDGAHKSARIEPLMQDIARLRGEEELAARHGATETADIKRELRESKAVEMEALIERERLIEQWQDIDARKSAVDILKAVALTVGKAAALAALGL